MGAANIVDIIRALGVRPTCGRVAPSEHRHDSLALLEYGNIFADSGHTACLFHAGTQWQWQWYCDCASAHRYP